MLRIDHDGRGGAIVIAVKELRAWLDTFKDDDCVGIDDGGLTLTDCEDGSASIEIGGNCLCEICGEPAGEGGALCPVHLEESGQ